MILVALAGPLTNGILAFVIAFLTVVVALRFPGAPTALLQALQDGVVINVSLGLFNLIPIPPLDGAHFITGLYPTAYRFLVRFGGIALLVLVLTGVVGRVIGPLVLGISNGFIGAAQAVL
jgi:Zn-dependent protease